MRESEGNVNLVSAEWVSERKPKKSENGTRRVGALGPWTLFSALHDQLTGMSSSCSHLLAALKDCLLHSDCVIKQGHLPSECLKEHADELPEQCKALRQATFECKRGMVRLLSLYVAVCTHFAVTFD